MSEEEGGPFLQAAFICEKVLQEADGVVSAIRIIDRFFIGPGPGQQAAAAMPAVVMSHTLFVTFKSGSAPRSVQRQAGLPRPTRPKVAGSLSTGPSRG